MPLRYTRMLLILAAFFASPAGPITAVCAAQTAISQSEAMTPPPGQWRRTSHGWQSTNNWPTNVDSTVMSPVARVHPVILASLIGLLSLGALIGFGSPQRPRN